jgi:hypothetical protein
VLEGKYAPEWVTLYERAISRVPRGDTLEATGFNHRAVVVRQCDDCWRELNSQVRREISEVTDTRRLEKRSRGSLSVRCFKVKRERAGQRVEMYEGWGSTRTREYTVYNILLRRLQTV